MAPCRTLPLQTLWDADSAIEKSLMRGRSSMIMANDKDLARTRQGAAVECLAGRIPRTPNKRQYVRELGSVLDSREKANTSPAHSKGSTSVVVKGSTLSSKAYPSASGPAKCSDKRRCVSRVRSQSQPAQRDHHGAAMGLGHAEDKIEAVRIEVRLGNRQHTGKCRPAASPPCRRRGKPPADRAHLPRVPSANLRNA